MGLLAIKASLYPNLLECTPLAGFRISIFIKEYLKFTYFFQLSDCTSHVTLYMYDNFYSHSFSFLLLDSFSSATSFSLLAIRLRLSRRPGAREWLTLGLLKTLNKQRLPLAYMYTYIKHTHIHTVHTYIHTYLYTYIHKNHTIHNLTCTYIHSYTHLQFVRASNMHAYIHTYIHTYTYIHTHIHIHTYIHI